MRGRTPSLAGRSDRTFRRDAPPLLESVWTPREQHTDRRRLRSPARPGQGRHRGPRTSRSRRLDRLPLSPLARRPRERSLWAPPAHRAAPRYVRMAGDPFREAPLPRRAKLSRLSRAPVPSTYLRLNPHTYEHPACSGPDRDPHEPLGLTRVPSNQHPPKSRRPPPGPLPRKGGQA